MGNKNKKLIVIGASGHAKVVIDILEKQGTDGIAFIVDDNPALAGSTLFGYPIVGMREVLLDKAKTAGVHGVIVAIGNNPARKEIAEWVAQQGFSLVSAIHPSAQIGRGVLIGKGTVVMAGAAINSDTVIGDGVIINTGATVDHDCRVGDFVHIAPGAHVCGGVDIGCGSLIGAGATLIPNLRIGSQAVLGAGSTAIRNIGDNQTAAGSPAREIGDV